MKHQFNFKDETTNFFKLLIYEWDSDNATKYYDNDNFCLDYCIARDSTDGCTKQSNYFWKCSFEHSINLFDLISQAQDYEKVKLLCLYSMYKRNCQNINITFSECYYYATVLYQTGSCIQDYLNAQKFFEHALTMSSSNSQLHHSYGRLLTHLNNYEKAEYHFRQALKLDPKSVVLNFDLGWMFVSLLRKYSQGLSYCETACELAQNHTKAHYGKAVALYKLSRLEESLSEYETCLVLNDSDGVAKLPPEWIQQANEQVQVIGVMLASVKTDNHDQGQKSADIYQDEKNENVSNINAKSLQIDENIGKFSELSIIGGIDDIRFELKQINATIDENVDKTLLKNRITTIGNKLSSVREKCNDYQNATDVKHNNKSTTLKEFQSPANHSCHAKLEKIKQEIKLVKQSSNQDSVLDLLIEIKSVQQKANVSFLIVIK